MSQRESKRNANAAEQREYQAPCIQAWLHKIAMKAYPSQSPTTTDFAHFGVRMPLVDPLALGRCGIRGN